MFTLTIGNHTMVFIGCTQPIKGQQSTRNWSTHMYMYLHAYMSFKYASMHTIIPNLFAMEKLNLVHKMLLLWMEGHIILNYSAYLVLTSCVMAFTVSVVNKIHEIPPVSLVILPFNFSVVIPINHDVIHVISYLASSTQN